MSSVEESSRKRGQDEDGPTSWEEEEGADELMEEATTILGTRNMIQLKMEISERNNQVKMIAKAHEYHVRKSQILLSADAVYTTERSWRSRIHLSNWKKEKEFVLLALRSGNVPEIMRWDKFSEIFPNKLLLDRDVLLARLALDDFGLLYSDKVYQIAKKFRSDAEVMIAVCVKSSVSLSIATKQLRNDPEVVLAAIQNGTPMAPFALQYASTKLKGDQTIAKAALMTDHGIKCLPFLPKKLQKDRRLILASIRRSSDECNREYQVLGMLPETFQDDEEIVIACVHKNGKNLLLIEAPDLRDDLDIVVAAVKQDIRLLKDVPKGSTRKELLSKRSHVLSIIRNGNLGGKILKYACKTLREDKALLLEAVANGLTEKALCTILGTEQVATLYHTHRDFFLDLLQAKCNVFPFLPESEELDMETIVECWKGEELKSSLQMYFKRHEHLYNDLDLLTLMLKRGFCKVLKNAPVSVLDTKSTMLVAVKIDSACLKWVSARLRSEKEVVAAALTSDKVDGSNLIFEIDTTVFQSDPDLAELAINAYDGKEHTRLRKHLSRSVFNHRNVVLAWCGKGWTLEGNMQIVDHAAMVENGYYNDHEVLAALLKNCSPNGSMRRENECRSQLNCPKFLAYACKMDDQILVHAPAELRVNYDLLLIALGSSRATLQRSDWHYGSNFDSMCRFSKELRDRLDLSNTFVLEFLRGISIHVPNVAPALRCHLPKLDNGYGTSASIARQIAEYADVPLGDELRLLRAAKDNLDYWGY